MAERNDTIQHRSGCLQCHGVFCGERVPIFRSLEEAEFAAIAKLIIHKDYDKGEIIFHEGDNFPYLAIVREGLI
ncbi:MAG TPA: hypothetical protein PKX45_05135, partial [Bacillota bacterium]|nr:hypothetical protein [Bacillota bacterium]